MRSEDTVLAKDIDQPIPSGLQPVEARGVVLFLIGAVDVLAEELAAVPQLGNSEVEVDRAVRSLFRDLRRWIGQVLAVDPSQPQDRLTW